MHLTITNKSEFVSEFLSPLSKINDSCILKITKDRIFSLLSATDNTVVVYGKHDTDWEYEDIPLNVPDLMRLIRILQCIEDDVIELGIESNHLKYSSKDIRFKYHLLDTGILSLPPISVEKIKELKFNTGFSATYNSFVNLIKGSAFAINLNKVYFFTKDGCVHCELTDKQSHNVDSMSLKVCDTYTGDDIKDPLPVGFETLRTVIGNRCDGISVKINTELNVMSFQINNNNTQMTYIVSGLVK